MTFYLEGQSVNSLMSSSVLRHPVSRGRIMRLTVTVCDVAERLTTDFPFVVS
jgi:hypothetical protein